MKKELVLTVVVIAALVIGYLVVRGRGKFNLSSHNSAANSEQNQTTASAAPSVAPQNSSAAAGSVENATADAPSQISLDIASPADGSTTTSSTIVVNGKTAPKADVFVNNQVGRADANGNFSFEVTLDPGENEILVDANDSNGNAAEKDITVTYNGQ